MTATVKLALGCMHFDDFTHIVVRERCLGSLEVLGGGHLTKVIERYGNKRVVRSSVVNGILFLDVEPGE